MNFTEEQLNKLDINYKDLKRINYNNIDITISTDNKEVEKSLMSKNVVQFRKGFINLENSGEDNLELAVSVVSELMNFGYTLNEEGLKNLSQASKDDIVTFKNEILSYIKIMIGADFDYKPFWPNFPNSVMSRTEAELWIHQILHYISNGEYIPNEIYKEKTSAFNKENYNILTSGDEEKFLNIFTELVSVNSSLNPDDIEIVEWFVLTNQKLNLPEQIPFKENLCLLVSLGVDCNLKTVTDVLRVASFMSGNSVELSKRDITIFKKFSRKERRFILNLLENTNCDESEAVLKLEKWIRLGEIIHPGEYKNKFPKSFEFFKNLRNKKIPSWYSDVDSEFKKGLVNGLEKLSERPGEFFRRIDSITRKNENKIELILEYINKIGTKVSNKVIFEVYEHFEKRKEKSDFRGIMIKGNRSITPLPVLDALNESITNSIQSSLKNVLLTKFEQLDKLPTVWIDEELKKIPLPKNMRSVSSSLNPIIRGERVSLNNKDSKFVRAFIHWYDEFGNQDLDLTAIFIGENKIESIGWNSHHNSILGCYSGDVRHRKGACAEYVDINIEKAISNGYKYVVIDVRNYNNRPFHSISQCVGGCMEIEKPIGGNLEFIPNTIEGCMRLNSDSKGVIMFVFDLETKEYITLDVDSEGFVATESLENISNSIRLYCEPPKFSVYDLIMMHINARDGEIVNEKDDAETVFEYENFKKSYLETLKLMGV